jgi:hypothetical protein
MDLDPLVPAEVEHALSAVPFVVEHDLLPLQDVETPVQKTKIPRMSF